MKPLRVEQIDTSSSEGMVCPIDRKHLILAWVMTIDGSLINTTCHTFRTKRGPCADCRMVEAVEAAYNHFFGRKHEYH